MKRSAILLVLLGVLALAGCEERRDTVIQTPAGSGSGGGAAASSGGSGGAASSSSK